ncbi:Uncharacterised protein [Salmonella enterica subsp. enterica serovar Bovismorbificans]|uniref:Uncharacterized protein n=1 Tax=Salmonella enterica subsp. enterica serovar Bovismorbificans TaxID=58097 RepID=A0A655BVV0_SALET|nr:Uncharacterised protein [Salmonella enterica subsp. enterica serovar Bovismorbificans]
MIQRFDELIATVWIAGKIGLANAGDHRLGFDLISVNRCQRQKENIASRYESIGDTARVRFIVRHRNAIPRQATDRQFVQ